MLNFQLEVIEFHDGLKEDSLLLKYVYCEYIYLTERRVKFHPILLLQACLKLRGERRFADLSPFREREKKNIIGKFF